MPNVVLVHTPNLQAREDFEEIAARIAAIDPQLKAFVATNDEGNEDLNGRIQGAPTLVFSPVQIIRFQPSRGRIYQGSAIDKITQYQRLLELGIPTPRTKLLAPGDTFSPAEWGEHLVLKPLSPKFQSSGSRIYRIGTRKLNFDLNINRMFEQYDVAGGTLVQQYINAGPELEYHRVLTLFGEPLYAMKTALKNPIALDSSKFPTETITIATQSYSPKLKTAEMIADIRYLDLAGSAYAAFPDRALQAVDIVRCHETDRLYVLEMNLGGNTWHFSSSLINAANSSRRRLQFKKQKIEQFGAFDVAARVLALHVRTEGL